MPSTVRVCPPDPLQAFAAGVFGAMGAEADIAAEVARHLVRANLSGHDSHGKRFNVPLPEHRLA